MIAAWPEMDATGPGVTDEDVRELENMLGTSLPDEYRAFLLDINGGKPGPLHRVLPLPAEDLQLRDLHSVSDTGAPFDLATRIARLRGKVPYPHIPIGSAASARCGGVLCLCVEGAERGSIWYLSPVPLAPMLHVRWDQRNDVVRVADSFGAFVASLAPLAS